MSSKLFEEAIADAKKLREVAEDNAKKAILEAVTPRIKEFIEAQLLENEKEKSDGDASEAEATEEMASQDEVTLDESALKSLIGLIGGEDILDHGSLDIVKEAAGKFSSSHQRKLHQIANKLNKKADILESRSINNNKDLNQENTTMSNREKFYEVDLQALRESIEKEVSEVYEEEAPMPDGLVMEDDGDMPEGDMYKDEMAEPTDEMEALMNEIRLVLDLGEDIEVDDLPEMLRGMAEDDEDEDMDVDLEEEDSEAPEGEDAPEGEEDMGDLASMFGDDAPAEGGEEAMNEVFEIDPQMLREELSRVRRLVREGKVDHHFGGKGSGSAGVDGAFGGKGKSNAGVSGAFGGGKEGQDPFTNPPQINKLNEAIRHLRRKNRAQAEKLNKYRGAVNTLREQLEDLNLFNAKLLYVNKLLQNRALSESQKKSVIKALDEAQTLSETKSLYKSLTESLSTSRGSSLNESARYGSSSRTTTSASSAKLQEGSDLGRWQKLAGLK